MVAGGDELGVCAFNVEVGRVSFVIFLVCCAEWTGVYFLVSWWVEWVGGERSGVAFFVAGVTSS